MDKIKTLIRNVLKEISLQESTMYDDGKNIPQGIRNWVKSFFGSDVPRYKINQGESEVTINMPWHEADRETYQFFKLENNSATPVGNGLSRSGMEGDSPQGFEDGQRKDGKVTVPEGYVLLCVGSYPKRAEIFTGQNVQSFLPNKEAIDLSPTELIILATAKGFKPHARPKFSDEHYANLISKGLLKSNRSITVDGRNVLEDPEIKEKFYQARDLYQKQTGRYISVSL